MPRVVCPWQSMNTWIATAYGLAMTAFRHGLQPRDTRHCEERSDAAVHASVTARNAATRQSMTVTYNSQMYELQDYLTADEKDPYAAWLMSLTDRQARARVLVRINRMASGNLGDVKPVGEGV